MKSEKGLHGPRVKEAFNDVVAPELNKIKRTIRNHRKSLLDSLKQDLIFGTGFVTVGLFSGLLPAQAGQVLAGIGGFAFASKMLEKANKVFKEPEEITKSEYYFLWRVEQLEK